MNKLVATTLESKFHVYDLRTHHPKNGYASLAQKVWFRLNIVSKYFVENLFKQIGFKNIYYKWEITNQFFIIFTSIICLPCKSLFLWSLFLIFDLFVFASGSFREPDKCVNVICYITENSFMFCNSNFQYLVLNLQQIVIKWLL